MAFTAGQKLRASDLNLLGSVVGRNLRTTNSSTFTTIARILSTRAPVKNGRSYRVACQGEVFGNSGAITAQMELRRTTDDTEPTTTSTVLGRALIRVTDTTGVPETFGIETFFHATADGFLRVALCGTRAVGSVTVAVSADATFPAFIVIEDIGDTVAASGTVY
jgi:hypothetical protein